MSEYRRRNSLVWPVVLIGFGVIFLLNNLGVIDWDIWYLLSRLWPLILVALGLDIMLGRRSGIGSAIALLLIIAIFAGGAWFVRSTGTVLSGDIYTQELVQPMEEAQMAKIDINFGVGLLEIGSFTSDENLARGTLELAEGEQLDQTFRMVGDTAYLSLDTHGQQFYPSWWFKTNDNERNWQIDLNDSIPTDLDINTGVGKSVLDLSGINLTNLTLDSGVGEVTIYLPGAGEYTVDVSGGVGQLTLHVPEGFSVQLRVDSGLGNTKIIGNFVQSGGVYTTPGFDETGDHAVIYVNGGVGEVVIVQGN